MSRHLKSQVVNRLCSTIVVDSQTASSSGVYSCARGTRYVTLIDMFVSCSGRINTFKEASHYRKNLIIRPSRRCPGKHVLYTCHIPKSWSAACVANRELIKLAQARAHAIASDPVARAEWEPLYLEHKANPAPRPKPYSTIFHFIYYTIYQSLRAEYLAARSALIARASRLAQTIQPVCALSIKSSATKRSVCAISMSASLPAHTAGISLAKRANILHSGDIFIAASPTHPAPAQPLRLASRSRPLIRLPIAA